MPGATEEGYLRRREADIALRSFRPTQPGLIATKLRDSDVGIYGNTEYVKQLGRPIPKSDLGSVHFIGFDNTDVFDFMTTELSS